MAGGWVLCEAQRPRKVPTRLPYVVEAAAGRSLLQGARRLGGMTDDAAAVPTGTPGGKAYYVTTPIYYVNDAPYIGHAYTTVAGDVLTRWHRQRGEDVWYLTGTDEHGQKVMEAAEKNGVTPQQWTDR